MVSRTECGSTLATTMSASALPDSVNSPGEVLAVDEDRVVVAPVDVEVAQLRERRVRGADAVEPRRGTARATCPAVSAFAQSRCLYSYFSLSMFSSLPGRATFSNSS